MDTSMNFAVMDEDSFPPPQSRDEYKHLAGLVTSIADFPRMTNKEQNSLVKELESYECYYQVDQLLRWRLARPDRSHQQNVQDYIWLMRILYLGLDSFDSFLDVARTFIRELEVPFATIRLVILDDILGAENFREHARLLQGVVEDVKDISQRVLLLERLALIYEKKLFLESEYELIYKKILTLDKQNEKARKFFKVIHIHNMEWAEAAEQLKVLRQCAVNHKESVRYTHELSQLYLYNLNQPGAALELLRPLASDYPEVRHSLLEAFERLDLVDDMLNSLVTFERTSRDREETSQFKYRRGNVLLKVGRTADAVAAFRESLELQPASLLIHESLVSALVELGSTHELGSELSRLRECVKLDSSRALLESLIDRVGRVNEIHASAKT